MILNVKYKAEVVLRQTTDDNLRKAIELLNNFVRDYDGPLESNTLEKINFLYTHFPFSKTTKDKYSPNKFKVLANLSNEEMKKEIEQICEELDQLREHKIETKLSKAFKLNDAHTIN